MIPTIQHSGKGKNMETAKRSVFAGVLVVVSTDEQVEHKGFLGQNTVISDIIMMNICYTFPQTHRMYNTKNELEDELQTLGDDVSILVQPW